MIPLEPVWWTVRLTSYTAKSPIMTNEFDLMKKTVRRESASPSTSPLLIPSTSKRWTIDSAFFYGCDGGILASLGADRRKPATRVTQSRLRAPKTLLARNVDESRRWPCIPTWWREYGYQISSFQTRNSKAYSDGPINPHISSMNYSFVACNCRKTVFRVL